MISVTRVSFVVSTDCPIVSWTIPAFSLSSLLNKYRRQENNHQGCRVLTCLVADGGNFFSRRKLFFFSFLQTWLCPPGCFLRMHLERRPHWILPNPFSGAEAYFWLVDCLVDWLARFFVIPLSSHPALAALLMRPAFYSVGCSRFEAWGGEVVDPSWSPSFLLVYLLRRHAPGENFIFF